MNIFKQFWLEESALIPHYMVGWTPFTLVRDTDDQQLYWVWTGYHARKVPQEGMPQGKIRQGHTGCIPYEEDPL